jgi:O-antigen/teichoic acid export membrane protein
MNVPTVIPTKLDAQNPDADDCGVTVPSITSSEGEGRPAAAGLLKFLRSVGLRDSLVMAVTMALAGGLDYAVSVLAGRWLVPVEYGIFIAVAAVSQVLAQLTNTIRNVVAFYAAEISAKRDSSQGVGAFVQSAWRWGWKWGLLATVVMALLSPALARTLRLPNAWPLWAATPVVLLFFVRTVTDGALQGLQKFVGFGVVQVLQSLLRLVIAAGLIWLGFQSVGAIIALPLAMASILALALWLLRPYFQDTGDAVAGQVSWHYSSHTLMGLAAFAVLANMDALFVKHFYSPGIAGNYGPVVTLAKMSLFIPLALGIVLLPKATRRRASGRDPRPILLLALAATLLPGFALTIVYFLYPDFLVRTIFTSSYTSPGIVLGLANLATTLYAGLNIWLNYALSLKRLSFIYIMVGVLVLQGMGMFFFGRDSLVDMTMVMSACGLIGNLAGFLTTWSGFAASDIPAALATSN